MLFYFLLFPLKLELDHSMRSGLKFKLHYVIYYIQKKKLKLDQSTRIGIGVGFSVYEEKVGK